MEAHKGTSGEYAAARFRELLSRGTETVPPDELENYGWTIPLITTCDPSPYCIPQEIFTFVPKEENIYKIFFKDTSKEVRIRQIFFHTALTDEEQSWMEEFRKHCKMSNWKIPLFLEPMVLRIIWLAYRKWGDHIITRSFDLAKMMVEWRKGFFPLSDQEEEMRPMLDKGVMYWVGRDQTLRPLLVIRLARLSRTASPEVFKRLTIFCFEWGLRYLMVPGLVETITVLLDVRGVPLHQFPLSALTDMTNTLTKQYPFRLNRMLIINDSFFVQTVWSIAKQFLTEVQQQKMLFFRTGFEEELMKEYTPWQLEKCYGGTRPEITLFYPFPVAPGPYSVGSTQESNPYKNAYLATDRVTSLGILWERDCRMPIQWAPGAYSVFKDLSLPVPEGLIPATKIADTGGEGSVQEEPVQEKPVQEPVREERVQAEPPNPAVAVAAAEAAAAEAEAACAAAELSVREAEAAAEASVREAEVAAKVAREAEMETSQDVPETKRPESPKPNGDILATAQPAAQAAEEAPAQPAGQPVDGATAQPKAQPVEEKEKPDVKEEYSEEPKKLTTVFAVTAPDQTESEARTPQQSVAAGEKTRRPVAKVRGNKCCSACNIQ